MWKVMMVGDSGVEHIMFRGTEADCEKWIDENEGKYATAIFFIEPVTCRGGHCE